MSQRSADLMALPWLPRRQIIENLLDDLGFAKAIVLRTVCRWFDDEILDAIMVRKLTCVRKGLYSSNGDLQFHIPKPIMARLLLQRLKGASQDDIPHLYAIDRIAQTLRQLCRPQIDEIPEDTITKTLLEGAVFHLYSWNAEKMTVPRSEIRDVSSNDSCHILAAAACLGRLDVVASLTYEGVDINTNSAYFGFPLRIAAHGGHIDVVRFLLEHGADANNRTGNACGPCRGDDTALEAASRGGDDAMARLLLEPKYGVQHTGINYNGAILDAVRRGHADLAIYLLHRCESADLDELQVRMFLEACQVGNIKVVQATLDNGIDVNSMGEYNTFGLKNAAVGGHASVVSLLLERGARFEWTYGSVGALTFAARWGHEDVVKVLLDNGADVNEDPPPGGYRNPLHEAAYHDHVNILRILIDRGADLSSDRCGEDALDYAISRGSEEVVRILAEAGANLDATDYEEQPDYPAPYIVAFMYGQYRIAQLLIDLGAKWVDPLTSEWAEGFRDGTYPKTYGRPPPLLKA